MQHKVKIKAEGDNASGKSYLLSKIRDYLKEEGFKVNESSLKEKHEIVIINDY